MTRHQNLRRVLVSIAPATLLAKLLPGQDMTNSPPPLPPNHTDDDVRLPNGKKQRDAILKADYEQNVKDAQDLVMRARHFQQELEKSDQYVLSLGLLKELDDMEKITRRIRGRMRRI
jgi:hypothetical protein